jgi:hypothetical protein
MVYTEKLFINDIDIIIRGGFTTCSQAITNNQSQARSVIDHTGLNYGAIIAVSGSNTRNTILLENLRLTGSASSGIESISADTEVTLINLHIDNNHITSGSGGGGISIISGNTDFMVDNSIIYNNSAEFGGGINCTGSEASLSIMGESGVSQNSANGILSNPNSGNGGGLFITNGCEVIMYSGTKNTNAQTLIGISGNNANADGGGLYVSQGASVFLSGHRSSPNNGLDYFGDDSTPVNLNNNISDLNNSDKGGGGAFITGNNTFLIITGGLIKDNSSFNGGGILTQDNSTLYVTRLENKCWNTVRCGFFQNNITKSNGKGGAIHSDHSKILITNNYFEDNQSDLGTAIFANVGGVDKLKIDVSIFNHNSKPNNGLNNKHVISLKSSVMEISHSTFADNTVDEAVIGLDASSYLYLYTSIIHESTGLAVSLINPNSIISGCLIVHDGTNIPFGGMVDNPEFIDRNNRDYHLNPNLSPAIDLCSDFAVSLYRDIDFNERHWDYPDIDNSTGGIPMSYSDAGADEVYDIIFENGFEN